MIQVLKIKVNKNNKIYFIKIYFGKLLKKKILIKMKNF